MTKTVKQKIPLEVSFLHAYEIIAKKLGIKSTQKAISDALGLTHGDLSNRKKRGTAALLLIDWGEKNGISAEELFPELGRLRQDADGVMLQDALIPVFSPKLLAGRLIAARELVGRSRKNVNMALQAENHAPVDFEDLCAHIERGLLKSLAGLYGLDDSELISWAYEEPIAASPPVEVEAARIGYRLRRMRGDWSPEQLSQKSGVYLEHVLWYESGIAEPNPDFAGLLAGALGCKPEDISGHGPMPAGLPIRDQAAAKMQGQSQPGHVQVRLPRGDPAPPPTGSLIFWSGP